MRFPRFYIVFAVLLAICSASSCKNVRSKDEPVPTVRFTAADGLPVTATLFKKEDSATWIVLCHQAGFSRGEYAEIAPKLMALGFNCMAVDARAGGEVNNVTNQTAAAAESAGKPQEFLDAKQDIEAAVNYAANLNGKKVILFGSSYSASLALVIAVQNPNVLAVVAFSPGEYFGDHLKVKHAIEHLDVPTFVASAKKEAPGVTLLFHGKVANYITQFVPTAPGSHGASALWTSTPNNAEYWIALTSFLKPYERGGMIRRMMKSMF